MQHVDEFEYFFCSHEGFRGFLRLAPEVIASFVDALCCDDFDEFGWFLNSVPAF